MKNYVEISRNTETQAQFLAQCRAALKNHPCSVYTAWVDYVNGAREEMKEIEDGKREKYYHNHRADDERQFDEICAASATSYQIYLNRKDERAFYNFNLEWEDGHGYFYCVDSMADEQTSAAIEPEKKEEGEPMKFKTTQREIKANYNNVIRAGYCNLQFLLHDESPAAYTVRAEGWGADVYTFGDTAIATGYAPFGNIRPGYDKCKEYNNAAAQMSGEWQEVKKQRRELINKFIEEVTQ